MKEIFMQVVEVKEGLENSDRQRQALGMPEQRKSVHLMKASPWPMIVDQNTQSYCSLPQFES